MKVLRVRTLEGPNVYTHRPVVVMTLDLEDLDGRESRDLPGFNARLLQLLPGLREHVCGKGYPGGFVERLEEGTYFGHVVEHVAIELGHPLGITGNYGKTVRAPGARCFDLVVESRVHAATRHLLEGAAAGIDGLVCSGTWDFAPLVEEAKRIAAKSDLGPSTRSIVEAATRRGIPWFRLNDDSLVQLGYGRRRHLIEAAMSDATSAVAMEIVQDKNLTKEILAKAFIPMPEGRPVTAVEEALEVLDDIGGPVVVKPADGSQGLGVTVGVASADDLRIAFAEARRHSSTVIVEQALDGDDYRVLVVGGRMVAASRRTPPHVVGDGVRDIASLVALENQDPRRGADHEKALTRIQLDDVALAYLRRQGLDPQSVPEAGARVMLRQNANLSTGGTATDVTDRVHPAIRSLCERAARIVGLDICGVDLVARSIADPPGPGMGIVELNAGPGLRMHLHPSAGVPRDAGSAIVDALFPDGETGRIPVVTVTGTNGKTTVTRMVGYALGAAGLKVGMTTTDGVWIDGEPIARGDMTGPRSARAVLCDPEVEVAVLETARGGIVRSGLGYDWSDVGVITNIQLDHVGQDGIETIDDIARIKSLVAERVKEGGTLVLNADDPLVMRILDQPRVARLHHEIRLFSAYPNHVRVRRHVSAGGVAYVPRNGWIVETSVTGQTRLVEISSIPAALGGAALFHLSNAMAAAAACRACGLSGEQVAAAFQSFGPHAHNEGRANLYRVGRGYVLVDYGHNPAAFAAIGEMAARWLGRRVSGVVGLPGDRADWLIEESARVATKVFDRIIVREDDDLRGRAPGEVPRLVCQAIGRLAGGRECDVVQDEANALRAAIDSMKPDEVIVVFYERLARVQAVLEERGAAPAARVEPLRVAEDGVLRVMKRA